MATARDFEFDRIEAFVKKHGATVLALQFPAHLLGEAPAVATARKSRSREGVRIVSHGAVCKRET